MKIRDGYEVKPLSHFQIAITHGDKAICMLDGYNMHPTKQTAWFLEEIVWIKGTSPRERLEAMVAFCRSGVRAVGASRKRDFKFFKKIAKDGHLRKAGVLHRLFPDESAMLWEVRSNDNEGQP